MRILTADEMRAADTAAIQDIGINGRVLMESAGRELVALLFQAFDLNSNSFVVVGVGPGNNGGDGFVVARTLLQAQIPVRLVSLVGREQFSGDPAANADAWLKRGGEIQLLNDEASRNVLQRATHFVDAFFGTGFTGNFRDGVAAQMLAVQEHLTPECLRIACDLPSGVDASTAQCAEHTLRADVTLAVQALKLGHVLFPGTSKCGDVYVADVGIEVPELTPPAVQRDLLTATLVAERLQPYFAKRPEAHKGTRGHVVVAGGSAGHFGAPKMSARAALEAGAGLVTMLLPERAAQEIQTQLVETMCVGVAEDSSGNFGAVSIDVLDDMLANKNAVVLGPGLGVQDGACRLLESALELAEKHHYSLVLDADALNLLANNETLQALISAHTILTPHPGEMARLANCDTVDVQAERIAVAREVSENFGCWVVLKGARTIIAGPNGATYINPTASDALATGGTGDVLAGLLGALLARGMSCEDAACCGTFIHGLAGESAAAEHGGTVGVVATDVIARLSHVMNALVASPLERGAYPGHAVRVLERVS